MSAGMDDVVCEINETKRVGTRYKVDECALVPLVKKDNIVECVNDSGVTLIVNGVPINELNVWIMKKLGFKTLIYMQRCNVLNVIQNRNYFFFHLLTNMSLINNRWVSGVTFMSVVKHNYQWCNLYINFLNSSDICILENMSAIKVLYFIKFS